MVGVLTESGRDSQVRITYQLPNSFRLDRLGNGGNNVVFDGNSKASSSIGALSEAEEDLMEAFLEDAPESMLFSLKKQIYSLRIIARHSRLDQSSIFEDIYELIGAPPSKGSPVRRQKHYYFNSDTHLASRVRYKIAKSNGTVVFVETLRGDWRKIGNEFVPAQIKRIESGQTVLAFSANNISTSPAVADGSFANAK